MENIKPSVHIILLNYNGYNDTIECIKSLNNVDYKNLKIVIVDNNSTDQSEKIIVDYIKQNSINNIKFIQTGKNLGFSGGNNIGIKWSLENDAQYICLLNNDTIVEPNFINLLIDNMENDPNIGISSGKIMYFDNQDTIWFAGGDISEIKALGYHYGVDSIDNGQFNEKKEVGFLTGCLQMIRRSVFEQIGLYEDQYFLYMEDVDFCYRTKKAGYKLMYIPESKIYHKVSASTGGQESPTVLYYMTRNRLLFNKKYQKNKIKSIMFHLFLTLKMIVEPFRKGKNYRYLVQAIKDNINNKYGYTELK